MGRHRLRATAVSQARLIKLTGCKKKLLGYFLSPMGDLGTSGKSVEHRHQQLRRATVAQLIAFCCWQATWLWSERFAAGSALTPLSSGSEWLGWHGRCS